MRKYRSNIPLSALLFVLLATIWGGSFVAIDVGLDVVPPLLFAALRYDVASVVVLAYAVASTDRWLPQSRDDWLGVGTGATLLIAIHHALAYTGQQYVPGAVASVVVSLVPVLTAVFAALTLPGERLEPLQYGGVALGFVGVIAVAAPDAGNADGASILGVGLVFFAAAAFAAGTVTLRKLTPRLSSQALQGWMMALGALLLHGGSLLRGESLAIEWTLPALGALAYLSLVAGAVAYLLYFRLLAWTGPSEATLVNYAQPIAATAVSWLLLGSLVSESTLGGLLTIFGGLALFKRRTLLRLVSRRTPAVPAVPVVAFSMHDVLRRR